MAEGSEPSASPDETRSPELGLEASGGSAPAAPPSANMYLPAPCISRIMRRVLPDNAKIPRDVRDLVQECASEFITFITSEANDRCCTEKRTTINADDLLWAMTILGFQDYIEPSRIYLQRFREGTSTTRSSTTRSSGASEGCSKDMVDPLSMPDS